MIVWCEHRCGTVPHAGSSPAPAITRAGSTCLAPNLRLRLRQYADVHARTCSGVVYNARRRSRLTTLARWARRMGSSGEPQRHPG
jgi:hypothetical protein